MSAAVRAIAARLRRRGNDALDREAADAIEALLRWQERVRDSSPLLARVEQLESALSALTRTEGRDWDGRGLYRMAEHVRKIARQALDGCVT